MATIERVISKVIRLWRNWKFLTEPVIDPKVWHEVPNKHVAGAKGLGQIDERTDRDGQTQITQHNQFGILGLKERARRVEVVDTTDKSVLLALAPALSLALVEVVASDISHEVVGPTNQLLAYKVNEGHDGCFFAKLAKLVDHSAESGSLLLAGAWDEHHVSLHVARCLVVLAVRNLPAEVRNEEGRMQDPSDSVVEDLGCAEGLVTTFVSQNPNTSGEKTLHDAIQPPECHTDRGLRNVLWRHVVMEQVERGSEENNVTEDIVESLGS